ncbi:hypothetical protein PSCFBP6110_00861 [Pseudomonas syringae pv. cerasicola]|nr:hypothetical protein PSCFBP6110_00861 [Pseudomonas syringae pv. cerasicola]
MPVRFLIYVAITALTRLLISDVSHHNPPDIGIIYLCGGILLLGFVRKVGGGRIAAMIGWRPAWQSVTNSPTHRGN